MADNIFTRQLSKARGSAADIGVVNNSEAMKYQANAQLIQTGLNIAGQVGAEVVGNYRVGQANDEINSALNDLSTEQSQAMVELEKSARDDLEREALKQEQGIISQQQKDKRINDIINKYQMKAPYAKDKFEAMRSTYGIGVSQTTRKAAAQSARSKAEQEALQTALTEREKLSYNLYGKSTSNINDKEFQALKDLEDIQARTKVVSYQAAFEEETYKLNNYSDKNRDFVLDKNAESFVADINNRTNAGLYNITVALSKDEELTEEDYNRANLNADQFYQQAVMDVTNVYAKQGRTVPQAVLNNLNTQKTNFKNSLGEYKKFTVEAGEKATYEEYKQAYEMVKLQSEIRNLNNKNITDALNLMNNPQMQLIRSDKSKGQAVAKKNATIVSDEYMVAKHTDANGVFDADAWFMEVKRGNDNVGNGSLIRFGGEETLSSIRAIATLPNAGMAVGATNLLSTEGSNHPQTDAINDITNFNNTKAEEAFSLTGNKLVKKGWDYVNSALSYSLSNNYPIAAPNSEIAMYQGENMIKQAKVAATHISEYAAQNPNDIFVEDGEIKTSNPEVNKSIASLMLMNSKGTSIPGFEDKMKGVVTGISQNAIDETIIKPLTTELDNLLNSPAFAALSPADKLEVREEFIKNSREIQQAEALKKRQAEKVNERANKLRGIQVNNNSLRTLTNQISALNPAAVSTQSVQAIGNSLTADNELQAKAELVKPLVTQGSPVNTLAYVGLKAESIRQKVANGVADITKNIFGDSLEEQIIERVDKRYGIPASQARNLRAIENKSIRPERAVSLYNNIQPVIDELENKQFISGLSKDEAANLKYYNKMNTLLEKNYDVQETQPIPERSILDTSNTELSREAREITEELIEDPTNDGVVDNTDINSEE